MQARDRMFKSHSGHLLHKIKKLVELVIFQPAQIIKQITAKHKFDLKNPHN